MNRREIAARLGFFANMIEMGAVNKVCPSDLRTASIAFDALESENEKLRAELAELREKYEEVEEIRVLRERLRNWEGVLR